MSAGSDPASKVSPLAVEVMKEIGIDISEQYPKSLLSVHDRDFDWVITLCDWARQACPIFHSRSGTAKHIHWPIPDPYESSENSDDLKQAYRDTRDEIGARIRQWLREELGIDAA
jgi:arsenate reductase